MDSPTEKLLKTFTELCEELISKAYVVTDGRAVMTTVIDHDLAIHLCKLVGRKTESNKWKVATIANAVEMAYRTGYETAVENLKKPDGDIDEKDSELRECDIQPEEESD